MKRFLILLFVALPLAADTLSFKVLGIDCAGCGPPIVKALSAVDGVKNAKVNTKTSIATVEVAKGFDVAKIRAAISNAGFESEFPGEKRADLAPLPADVVKSLDIVTLDGKAKIDVAKLLAPNKITIIDFYADWCGPCAILEGRMQRYMAAHPNIALRRVNIGKWDNAAAAQATREFHLQSLPYLRVYAPDGRFVRPVNGGMWDEVLEVVEAAGR